MGAAQSNLSDPKFGYDLVVAVTQASINATMKQFLAGLTAPEVVSCYVYDQNNNLIPISYADLKARAKGADPFQVLAGADPNSNQDLINLTNANFAGGFKARLGLPDVAPGKLPPIMTLSRGTNAPVLFNLLCAEFQITGFEYGPRGRASWINQSQPTGAASPWYFSANVALNTSAVDVSNPPAQATSAVKDRINDLRQSVGANAFSVQQLFLALDTAILQSQPTIVGIPAGWAVWELISSVFLDAYMKQMRVNGTPVLGYSVTVNRPDRSKLQLGAISYETCTLLDGSSNPIANPTPAQQAAATFNYLGTTGTVPPTATLFPWNWVEEGEVASFSGVQSVRRDIFVNFFAGLLNQDIGRLCQQTKVSLSHSGDDYHIRYSSSDAPDPKTFQPVKVGARAPDGFTEVLSLTYDHKSHDDSEAADHLSSIHGDFNYMLAGSVALKDNVIRLIIHAAAWMKFNHHEAGINYDDLPGKNYYDKTLTVTFQISVTDTGELKVTKMSSMDDKSAGWDFHGKGIIGTFGFENNLRKGLTSVEANLASRLDDKFASYESEVTNEINSQKGWVFPGSSTFVFKNVAFSAYQDLVAQLTYAAP
ncbi:hypothetical protein Nham_1160 [Nitrobacter hamburgensis X14]|uniref:Uncharacterized protein n=1 Tax=Nitrobacter hamburgensis (strain DSM 10229 / NCIMB 13809 / X14) TaxID=323097 RepID=Q1QP43_NITHX|nr:hypothetical protein [Nitrobacter hamburgensis]ABE62004.1 hypothetical protein Nham_1160 [Nitrobacter hamburgensis X14]